jgi:hypothetical protein
VRAFYHHTQTGAALRWGLILPAIGLFAVGFAARRAVPFVPLAALLAATGWAFSSLTVEITPTRLIWFFGPGLLRKSIEREAIMGVTPVRNPGGMAGASISRRAAGFTMSAGSTRSNSP